MLAVFRSELDRVKEKDTHCPVSLGQVVCTCVEVAFDFLQMLAGRKTSSMFPHVSLPEAWLYLTPGMNRSLNWLRASKRSCGHIHNSDTKIAGLQHAL